MGMTAWEREEVALVIWEVILPGKISRSGDECLNLWDIYEPHWVGFRLVRNQPDGLTGPCGKVYISTYRASTPMIAEQSINAGSPIKCPQRKA